MNVRNMITCDDVFDVLTRGPFPTGTVVDPSVEDHLASCAACRELAEALRPSVSLFREVLADEERLRLTVYRGSATAAIPPGDSAQLTSRASYFHAPVVKPGGLDAPRIVRYLISVFAVSLALIVAFVWGAGTSLDQVTEQHSPVVETDSPVAGQIPPGIPDDDLILAGFNLPDSCLLELGQFTAKADNAIVPERAGWNRQCCTRCHAPTGAPHTGSPRTLAIIVASCRTCHVSSPHISGS